MKRARAAPAVRALVVAVAGAAIHHGVGAGAASAQSLADTIPVFEVLSYDCRGKPEERAQSGFLVEGVEGVVTALHGVVGCDTRANWDGGTFDDLVLQRVDVSRDVAVLSSAELERAIRTGALRPQRRGSPPASQSVAYVVGFPGLVRAHVIDLTVERTSRPISELMPATPEGDALLALLRRRRSPAQTVRVVSLVGPLQAGHSGAPVVDAAGRVFAIGNGGFTDLSIVWAIPLDLDSLGLVEAGVESVRLERLATDPESERLFSFGETNVRPLAFRPSVSTAAMFGTRGWDWQLRYRIPLWRGGRRISAIFAFGVQRADFDQDVQTLPGLDEAETTVTTTSPYIAAGADYRLRFLPDRLVDPYVRISVGDVLEKGINPRLGAALGFDLLLTPFAKTFFEVTAVGARLTRDRFTFTRLGSPTKTATKVWVNGFGASVGIGFAVGPRT